MDEKDTLMKDSSYEKLLHNKSYYLNVFKKTEKIVSVVFYILNNVDIDKKSETHTSNLASKAHFAHENALRSLDAKPATSREVLEQYAQSLVGLESSVRIARIASVIPQDAHDLLCTQIKVVLHNLSEYIEGDNILSSLIDTMDGEGQPASSRATTRPSRTRSRSVTPATEAGGGGSQLATTAAVDDRRTRIQTILEAKGEASIKDISEIITDISEKTIQRELNTMIEDNVVKREGERRWSRYSIA